MGSDSLSLRLEGFMKGEDEINNCVLQPLASTATQAAAHRTTWRKAIQMDSGLLCIGLYLVWKPCCATGPMSIVVL